MIPRIKICCIQTVEESQIAIGCGASAVGLVAKMPSGPGPISEEQIALIASQIPPGVSTFLLTCETDADTIIAQHMRCRTSVIQLVDTVEPGIHQQLREKLPGIRIVQVIHVRNDDSINEALDAAPGVHALLLDSGNPDLKTKELGGTGRVHDWEISREIVRRSPIPVFLAGGLTPENVAEAVRIVQPFAVDVCSGLRTNGTLDKNKVERFAAAVKADMFKTVLIPTDSTNPTI
jgi:phosphoribosylanthranilate isomerase